MSDDVLPDEMWQSVANFCSLGDFCALRATCRRMHATLELANLPPVGWVSLRRLRRETALSLLRPCFARSIRTSVDSRTFNKSMLENVPLSLIYTILSGSSGSSGSSGATMSMPTAPTALVLSLEQASCLLDRTVQCVKLHLQPPVPYDGFLFAVLRWLDNSERCDRDSMENFGLLVEQHIFNCVWTAFLRRWNDDEHAVFAAFCARFDDYLGPVCKELAWLQRRDAASVTIEAAPEVNCRTEFDGVPVLWRPKLKSMASILGYGNCPRYALTATDVSYIGDSVLNWRFAHVEASYIAAFVTSYRRFHRALHDDYYDLSRCLLAQADACQHDIDKQKFLEPLVRGRYDFATEHAMSQYMSLWNLFELCVENMYDVGFSLLNCAVQCLARHWTSLRNRARGFIRRHRDALNKLFDRDVDARIVILWLVEDEYPVDWPTCPMQRRITIASRCGVMLLWRRAVHTRILYEANFDLIPTISCSTFDCDAMYALPATQMRILLRHMLSHFTTESIINMIITHMPRCTNPDVFHVVYEMLCRDARDGTHYVLLWKTIAMTYGCFGSDVIRMILSQLSVDEEAMLIPDNYKYRSTQMPGRGTDVLLCDGTSARVPAGHVYGSVFDDNASFSLEAMHWFDVKKVAENRGTYWVLALTYRFSPSVCDFVRSICKWKLVKQKSDVTWEFIVNLMAIVPARPCGLAYACSEKTRQRLLLLLLKSNITEGSVTATDVLAWAISLFGISQATFDSVCATHQVELQNRDVAVALARFFRVSRESDARFRADDEEE